jgi:hypothetical protein
MFFYVITNDCLLNHARVPRAQPITIWSGLRVVPETLRFMRPAKLFHGRLVALLLGGLAKPDSLGHVNETGYV